MALVKFGGGVAGMSGKIAGTVFSRTRAGAVARGWSMPVSTPTTNQANQRVQFAEVAAAWNALDFSVRDAWRVAAEPVVRKNRLGEDYTPSGREMFMSSNMNLATVGDTLLSAPPIDFLRPDPFDDSQGIAAEQTANALVSLDLTTNYGSNTDILVECVNPAAPSQNATANVSNQWRSLGAFNLTTPEYGANMLTAFNSIFGGIPIITGTVLQFRIAIVAANGQRSDWRYMDKVEVTAAA